MLWLSAQRGQQVKLVAAGGVSGWPTRLVRHPRSPDNFIINNALMNY